MAVATAARTMLDSLVDEKGRTLRVEIRESDGYFNATLMCQSAGKTWSHYIENKRTGLYLDRLSTITGIPRKELVSETIRSEGTWVHPEVGHHLRHWCQESRRPRDASGYVYLATSQLLDAVKIGCWTGSLANLKSRYATPYGPSLHIENVFVSNCHAGENQMHQNFAAYNKGGELFDKRYAGEYSRYADNKMAVATTARTMLDSLVDEKGRTLRVEIRESDGYFNATLMCQSVGKQISDYTRLKSSGAYESRLSAITGIPRKELVSETIRSEGTWVHRKVAIHLAQWISPDFAVWVTDLVEKFVTGQITTEQSRAAAVEVADAVAPSVPPQLIQWNRQRGDSRDMTKAKSDTLREVTDGKAHSAYWRTNDAINKGATGKTTKELRVELGIKKGCTPRDRMGAPMLGMITFQEGMVDKALREAKQDKGDYLKDWEAIGVAETVTDEAEAFCKKTKGFELPMLQYKPPEIKQVQKALQAKKPTLRQQRLITAAMMPVLKALPAPPVVQPMDTGDLYD